MQQLSPELAQYYGLSRSDAVLIAEIIQKTPAERAGLRTGDIILDIDNITMSNLDQVREKVSKTEQGEMITVGIWRSKSKITVNVTCESS